MPGLCHKITAVKPPGDGYLAEVVVINLGSLKVYGGPIGRRYIPKSELRKG